MVQRDVHHLPDGAKFEISMQWAAIGWAVPAAFGYGMGLEPDRRSSPLSGMVASNYPLRRWRT